jgi:uncharacterized protein (DUF1697 family)
VVYAALLRAVNLGARNKLAMADLRRVVEEAGGQDAQTYVQSGNIVFRSSGGRASLEKSITKGIRAAGVETTVMMRTARQLAQLVAGNPFVQAGVDPAELHVAFLAARPQAGRVRELSEGDFGPEQLALAPGAVYLHMPTGYGRAKLGNAFIEKQLGVPATTRNWRTACALAELAASL